MLDPGMTRVLDGTGGRKPKHHYPAAFRVAGMLLLVYANTAISQQTDLCNNNLFGTGAIAPCPVAATSVGSSNVIGTGAGISMTGSDNNVMGTGAAQGMTGLYSNVIGYHAGQGMTGSNSNAIGFAAGQGMTGSRSTVLGFMSGQGMTGSDSTVIGSMSGAAMGGSNSVVIGNGSGLGMVSPDSIVVGNLAGGGMTGSNISVVGNSAGIGMSGSNNSVMGFSAGGGTTGSDNSIVGYFAGGGMSGSNNTVIGKSAGVGMSGSYSNVLGATAAAGMTGSNNNVIGNAAGQLMTGSNNNVLGNASAQSITGSNNVILGNDAGTLTGTLINRAAAIGDGTTVLVSGAVALGSGSTAGSANKGQAGFVLNGITLKNNLTATTVVGVGNRQITGVADGALGPTSTDAVNGSQLYATDQAINSIVTGSNMVVYNDSTHTAVTLGGAQAADPVALDNVAPGALNSLSTSAVNGSQLFQTNANITYLGSSITNAFGGGATYVGGVFTGPSYTIQGALYTNVGSALEAVDRNLTNIFNQTTPVNSGPAGPAGAPGAAGPPGTNGIPGKNIAGGNAVQYDQAAQTSVTLGGVGSEAPVKLGNVAAGIAGTDAVNVEQMNAQTTTAVQTANSYTDNSSRQTLNTANNYTDQSIAGLRSQLDDRFSHVNTSISRVCAMGTAMTQMAMAGASAGQGGRIAAGVGLCSGGASAVAAGYAEALNERTHFNFGAAISAGMGTVGAGVGYDLP